MKSPTPIKLGYLPGVEPTLEFKEWCEEKGHVLHLVDLPYDMILGPHVYNHQGTLEKKHFDLYTKSMRATMRETKKVLKGGVGK